MPVYEYQCSDCHTVFEVQQKLTEPPLDTCPQCSGPVRKLVSMTSFQLKGGGWYSDGYASIKDKPKEKPESTPTPPPCQTGASCAGCPAAAGK
jgi:putative FmdB family regulatory protein